MDNNKEKYTFLHFIKDEKFIRWKLLADDALTEYWQDFLQKNPDARESFEQAEVHFKNVKLSSYTLSKEEKKRLFADISQSRERLTRKRRRLNLSYIAAAACCALLAVSVWVARLQNDNAKGKFADTEVIVGNRLNSENITLLTEEGSRTFTDNNVSIALNEQGDAVLENGEKIDISAGKTNKLIVPYGKRSFITLTDGTRIWLNSGSQLEFPAAFGAHKREIALLGEAYLEVSPDSRKPFVVHASGFDVKVHGTKFNVSAYADDSSKDIVLVEGSVSVAGNNKELTLKANEKATLAGQSLTKETVDVSRYISWKNGYLIFDNAPISDVLRQVARYYNLSFSFDRNVNMQARKCTGKIMLSDDLNNVLTTIALLSGSRYEQKNENIYIYSVTTPN